MKIKSLCLLLLFSFGCVKAEAARKDPFTKGIAEVERATVAVVCAERSTSATVSLKSVEGTAFFVSNDGTIITAGHVARALFFPAAPEKPCQIPAIYMPTGGWKSGLNVPLVWFEIKRCNGNTDSDLAVCTLVDNPFVDGRMTVKPLFVKFETVTQKEGAQIAFAGFPLQIIQPIAARATVAGYMGGGGARPRTLLIDHNNWPGMSGSPVFLSNGKVIGLILARGTEASIGLSFARSSTFILDFLSKNAPSKRKVVNH